MRARGSFPAPPHCPYPHCPSHAQPTAPWRWARAGFYTRRAAPQRIQRYRCGHCGGYFSDQTFSTTYWLKRPALLPEVFHALTHCTGFRQLARKHGGSPQTFQRHALRLGRHALLFHELHRPRGPLAEPLVLDGLRTFEFSQYHPSEFHLLLGQDSDYTYGFTHSELRRSGRMTARQRARREAIERRHGRADPRSVRREVSRLLGVVTAGCVALELWSDEHAEYPRALAEQRHLGTRRHHTVSSRAWRDQRNPLRAANAFDAMTRHSCANQKRETIAYSKAVPSSIARMWVFAVWRNHIKWRSERRRGETPAMRVGASDHRWSVRELLAGRLFPWRVPLPAAWADHYWGRVPTRRIPHGTCHSALRAA
jgi:transposase-like protein